MGIALECSLAHTPCKPAGNYLSVATAKIMALHDELKHKHPNEITIST
jgi:hypothetical protein